MNCLTVLIVNALNGGIVCCDIKISACSYCNSPSVHTFLFATWYVSDNDIARSKTVDATLLLGSGALKAVFVNPTHLTTAVACGSDC